MLSHIAHEKGIDQPLQPLIETSWSMCTAMTFRLLSHHYIADHQATLRRNKLPFTIQERAMLL